jgi:ParB/RepB/Spo0J family partition protein
MSTTIDTITRVPLELIDDNPFQPRASYSRDTINEIAHSIKQVGLIHAPLARKINGRYEIAEGHLRKRAYLKLQKENPEKWSHMPLDIREISDQDMALIALEENLKRRDITPLETARAVDKYLTSFTDISESALATKMNMTQGNISNMRRVLTLPAKILEKIDEGKISFTMGRELLIFKGLNAGTDEQWSSKESRPVKVPKDEEWLMLKATQQLGDRYGCPATVDGIKKAIFGVCEDAFKHLEPMLHSWGDKKPLWNTKESECFKCDHCIRAFETKTQARHFCTDPKCWDRKQEAHKKKMATAAKKKMEEDIAQRIAAAENHRTLIKATTGQTISQEMAAEMESKSIIPQMSHEEIRAISQVGEEEKEAKLERFKTIEEVCQGCLNRKTCERTKLHTVEKREGEEQSMYVCTDRLTKQGTAELRAKARATMPESFKKLVTEKAGTRAEVLDLRDIRLGTYGDGMKAGYVNLDSGFDPPLEHMIDPDECKERCTTGFHYAFNSGDMESGQIYMVCTNPKCVSQKKAAFTRAKNAEGQAKKKAEMKAIKEAVDITTELDLPRLRLIFHSVIFGRLSERYYGTDSPLVWLIRRLGLKTEEQYGDQKKKPIWEAIDKQSRDELQKLLVEFSFNMLTYQGDINTYKIQTTEPLNWLGISPKVELPKTEPQKEAVSV